MEKSLRISLINKIKEKKEFSEIDDSVVDEFLEKVLKKYGQSYTTHELKIICSETRGLLRKVSGRFQKKINRKKGPLDTANVRRVLQTHFSTSERMNFYPKIKQIIFSYKPSSILDLGCGLNPLAIASKNVEYFASDIKKDELETVKNFFAENKINGKVFIYNLRKISDDLPAADICLIFKVLDILGEDNHSLSKKILKAVKCKIFIVSFAIRKLSGKKMLFPERKWFERILKEFGWPFEKIYSENEVFYVFKKSG